MKDLRAAMILMQDYQAFAGYYYARGKGDRWYQRETILEAYLKEQGFHAAMSGGPGNEYICLFIYTALKTEHKEILPWMRRFIASGEFPE